jgi:Mrp family chromosome partitioning ATPase
VRRRASWSLFTHQLKDIDPRLVMLADPTSPGAAAYRIFRQRLRKQADPRVILVTSAHAREGKTLCAANLAFSISECDAAHTLLVEANATAPTLSELFRFTPSTCFLEQLWQHRWEPDRPWAFTLLAGTGVSVAAIAPENKSKQVADWSTFQLALGQYREHFDYVVIDAPPILGTAEVNMIQDATDGLVIVAAASRSRGREVKKALDQLQPVNVLGVAMIEDER